MLINETEDASEKQRLKMMQNHRVNIKIKPNRLSLDSINSDFDNFSLSIYGSTGGVMVLRNLPETSNVDLFVEQLLEMILIPDLNEFFRNFELATNI